MGSRLAWLDHRRQLFSGPAGQRLPTAPVVAWGTSEAMRDEEAHSGPTRSPDGRRWVSFRIAEERGLPCHVRGTEADGVTASSRSHALSAVQSQHLVLAGDLTDHDAPGGTPRIWRVGLDDEQLDEGMFATYASRRS